MKKERTRHHWRRDGDNQYVITCGIPGGMIDCTGKKPITCNNCLRQLEPGRTQMSLFKKTKGWRS